VQSNSTAEIMAESIALQGFSFEEWNAHRDGVVAKVSHSMQTQNGMLVESSVSMNRRNIYTEFECRNARRR
jgi:hypothetical protein